jgi:transaldolase
MAEGAVGCTCNPSYCQKMLDHPTEGAYAQRLLDECLAESDDDPVVQAALQRKLVAAIADRFSAVYEQSDGEQGHVSIQGDPVREHDSRVIIEEAHANGAIADNMVIKIPTTAAGLTAMETLVDEGYRINATEIMGIAQALDISRIHGSASARTGPSPKLYLSHITGIYDEYLQRNVDEKGIDIAPDILWQGGLAIARKLYAVMSECYPPATFVGGGARGLQHFTEMVGGDLVVTINWNGTADALLESNPPVVSRLFNPVEDYVIDELMEKVPDWRRGYLEDGLSIDEYEDFGPVVLFRDSFLRSWRKVLALIADRRTRL